MDVAEALAGGLTVFSVPIEGHHYTAAWGSVDHLQVGRTFVAIPQGNGHRIVGVASIEYDSTVTMTDGSEWAINPLTRFIVLIDTPII